MLATYAGRRWERYSGKGKRQERKGRAANEKKCRYAREGDYCWKNAKVDGERWAPQMLGREEEDACFKLLIAANDNLVRLVFPYLCPCEVFVYI